MQIKSYSGSPIVARSSQLGEFNFGDLFDKITSTASNIYATKAQIDAQKQAYKLQQQQLAYQAQLTSQQQYSPNFDFNDPNSPIFDGGGFMPQTGFPVTPVLIGGGLLLAAYFLLVRK